ncbi:chorismate mutase [Thermococcus sp.]
MERLHELRTEIDGIDRQIIGLLEERAKLTREIGKIKRELNLPVKDEKREEEVLKRAGRFREVFKKIVEVCRNEQF